MLHPSRAALLFWVPLACLQPVCVALLGVLTRYLQTDTQPSWPPLRLTSLMCMIEWPVVLALQFLRPWLAARWRDCQAWRAGTAAADSPEEGSKEGSAGAADGLDAGLPEDVEKAAEELGCKAPPPSQPVPGAPWRQRQPRLYRLLGACAISAAQSAVLVLMILAPRLVDASVTQLVSMFTVVGVALVGWLWLRIPIPRPLYFAAVAMLAGALMVMLPDILAAVGPGSLSGTRGWLGFAASVGVWLSLVAYISFLQAFKSLGISPYEVMHWVNGMCLFVCLPISLGVDGANWAAQFAGMRGLDYAYLFLASVVGILGMIILSQARAAVLLQHASGCHCMAAHLPTMYAVAGGFCCALLLSVQETREGTERANA
ncbi:hypothetical protein ABPG75_010753 [Micractinium tetrahymenae]